MPRGDITDDDIPNDVVIQTAIHEHFHGRFDAAEPLANACVDRLHHYGRVIVRAADINAVLGPDPGCEAYIASGKRLLAAIEDPIGDKETTR